MSRRAKGVPTSCGSISTRTPRVARRRFGARLGNSRRSFFRCIRNMTGARDGSLGISVFGLINFCLRMAATTLCVFSLMRSWMREQKLSSSSRRFRCIGTGERLPERKSIRCRTGHRSNFLPTRFSGH